jgi:hypothetical protein
MKISVERAVALGMLFVNGPIVPIMVGPLFLALPALHRLEVDHGAGTAIFASMVGFGGGSALAWLWWSITVPRWRLWADKRVEDVAQLKILAVKAGLTWPDGHVFERTEIKTAAHAEQEKAFDRKSPSPDAP